MEELTIGQRIAARRKELGLSQIELGERMGVSRQSVSKWEADAAIPEIDKLIALSKLFAVSVGWLLGVEGDDAPSEAPEQTFTEREWEIIDRLAREQPGMPRWLVPVLAGVAAVALTAAVLAGMALHGLSSRKTELAIVSQSVAELTASLGGGLTDVELLGGYEFLAEPSPDLQECSFRFTGVPGSYEPESRAELIVVLGGETVVRQECQWDGMCYSAEFTLPTYDGYTASFCLTGRDGVVRTSRVYDELLYRLLEAKRFGGITIEYDSRSYDGGFLIYDGLRVSIDCPAIFRDVPELWAGCDLVVMAGDRELGRLDLMNRSEYSKAANFGSVDVDFYTRQQRIEVGDISGLGKLEIMLVGRLTNATEIRKTVDLWL